MFTRRTVNASLVAIATTAVMPKATPQDSTSNSLTGVALGIGPLLSDQHLRSRTLSVVERFGGHAALYEGRFVGWVSSSLARECCGYLRVTQAQVSTRGYLTITVAAVVPQPARSIPLDQQDPSG